MEWSGFDYKAAALERKEADGHLEVEIDSFLQSYDQLIHEYE